MKVMYCVHHYMSGCDMAKFTKEMNTTAQQVNITMHRKLEMVGKICNVTKMVKSIRMMENGTSLQEQMSHMFEGVSQMISAVVKGRSRSLEQFRIRQISIKRCDTCLRVHLS